MRCRREGAIGSRSKLEEQYSASYAQEVEEAFDRVLRRLEASAKPLTAFERDCLFAALMAILAQSYSLAMAAILACNGEELDLPFFPEATTDVTLAGLRQAFAEIAVMRASLVSWQHVPAGEGHVPR